MEIYKELIADKKGEKPANEGIALKREKMKNYLKETLKTTEID